MLKSKDNGSTVAIISGIIVACVAIASAVYFIMKFVEKKQSYDYIECDCYDDYDEDDDYDCCENSDDISDSTVDEAEVE